MPDANLRANTDAKTDTKAARIAWAGLLACVGLVIAAGFALTFHGIYGYGRDVAHWGPVLAALGPIADDGLTLVAIAAAWLLTHVQAPLRARSYAWAVFGLSCAASIGGNIAYAVRPLPVWAGAIGSALCPVFVTLAAHLGVVCWRHWRPTVTHQPPAKMPASASGGVPVRRSPKPPRMGPPQGDPAPPSLVDNAGLVSSRDGARVLYAGGVGAGEILSRWVGKPPTRKTIENWTRDLRDQHNQARAAKPSNGAVPATGGSQ